MKTFVTLSFLLVRLLVSHTLAQTAEVTVAQQHQVLTISNASLVVDYDLQSGTYRARDLKAGQVMLSDLRSAANDYHSNDARYQHSWTKRNVYDALGKGMAVRIQSKATGYPTLLLDIILYEDRTCMVLNMGLHNTLDEAIQLQEVKPVAGGHCFEGMDVTQNLSLLDGNSGGEKSSVRHEGDLECRNNLLMTFGSGEDRQSLVIGGLTYHEFEKFAAVATSGAGKPSLSLYAHDPVGRRIDPGVRYMPRDRFYCDFLTPDPFEALETYAGSIQKAQSIDVSKYHFPTVCLWYAGHPEYGGGPSNNTTLGAVREARAIKASGFLKYSSAAVRLVPDSYYHNNQQGWWDDEHWQDSVVPHNGSLNGVYLPPYETTAKWAGTVKDHGVIPLTYFQTGFRSDDYVQTYPEHMLFDTSLAWKDPGKKLSQDDKAYRNEWIENWKRNHMLWSYDYTDPGFVAHMQDVYANLDQGGVRGLMYDYPATGWAAGGGMEDEYATTAYAYRQIFSLAREGLGLDCYLHERNLKRGSDITLGLVASQRIWGDTDAINPEMITRGGLRWYKNRSVVSYDMDAKSLHKTHPANRDGRRTMLTLAYFTSGRLLLGTSFSRMDDGMLTDLSRVFPFHTQSRSPRPIDAFVRELPLIYDFEVSGDWHQVMLWNPDTVAERQIEVPLAGEPASGALGLEPGADFHLYDFWNDQYLGTVTAGDPFAQTLRAGEARIISMRRVMDHPQVISSDRHIMQGMVELDGVRWHASARVLSGKARVIGGETLNITIAANDEIPVDAYCPENQAGISLEQLEDGLFNLSIIHESNDTVTWSVLFKQDK